MWYCSFHASAVSGTDAVSGPVLVGGLVVNSFLLFSDADRVVKTKQVLKDKEFPEEYPLTVYTFTPEVGMSFMHLWIHGIQICIFLEKNLPEW